MVAMTTITPAEFATEVGSTGREVRKFLRSITPREEQPGKGPRWALDGSKRSINQMTKNFNVWKAAQLELAAKRAQEAAQAASEAVEVEDDAPDA
jgi:hypothetical protein